MAYNTDQMRQYQRLRRAARAGFNARDALFVYEKLKAMGLYEYEARSAVMSAARDGLFGNLQR